MEPKSCPQKSTRVTDLNWEIINQLNLKNCFDFIQ